jgi:hypothetical protein
MDNNHTDNLKENIDNLQHLCNDLYERYGATSTILDLQRVINTLHEEYNDITTSL